jgi:hypothetical protein
MGESPDDPDRNPGAATIAPPSPVAAPSTLGAYRLLERPGEGGMGEVWLAEQTRPAHRQVALKGIKAGIDTARVVARFEAERQALALMSHPSIAQVFDQGLQFIDDALAIRRRVLPTDHLDLADSYAGLAFAASRSGDFAQMEHWHSESLMLLRRTLGERHPRVPLAQNNLAAAQVIPPSACIEKPTCTSAKYLLVQSFPGAYRGGASPRGCFAHDTEYPTDTNRGGRPGRSRTGPDAGLPTGSLTGKTPEVGHDC